MVFPDNSFSIGRTPLVKLHRITEGGRATVLAKIEGRNPGYSVKDRIGAAMVWDAEQRGALKPGKELIEPTSGNTGIALAFVAAARGYPITLVMPESYSLERRKVVRAFGARLVLTDASKGMDGAIEKAEEIVASAPDRYVMPKGVVSILDKFPGICYNRLWTYCLLGGGDMGRMVIEVPEELTELGKAMAEQLAEVQRTMARQGGGKAVDYALVEQAMWEAAGRTEREAHRAILQSLDIDVPAVVIGKERYTRVGRGEDKYHTRAGCGSVVRAW